jgi:hypothetical protein
VNIASVAEAVTIVSNLGNAFSGSAVVQDNFWVAQSFTTNNASYCSTRSRLRHWGMTVQARLSFAVRRRMNQPEAAINSLSGPGTPTIFTDYTYAPTAPVIRREYKVLGRCPPLAGAATTAGLGRSTRLARARLAEDSGAATKD